jgi:hypothetical protein
VLDSPERRSNVRVIPQEDDRDLARRFIDQVDRPVFRQAVRKEQVERRRRTSADLASNLVDECLQGKPGNVVRARAMPRPRILGNDLDALVPEEALNVREFGDDGIYSVSSPNDEVWLGARRFCTPGARSETK